MDTQANSHTEMNIFFQTVAESSTGMVKNANFKKIKSKPSVSFHEDTKTQQLMGCSFMQYAHITQVP